jgi:hypothetical protein
MSEPELPLGKWEPIKNLARARVLSEAAVDEIDAEILREGMRNRAGGEANGELHWSRAWHVMCPYSLPARVTIATYGSLDHPRLDWYPHCNDLSYICTLRRRRQVTACLRGAWRLEL